MTTPQMKPNSELEDIVRQGEKEIAEGNIQPKAIDDLWM